MLQNLTSDVQVFLNTECDSLSVPARQIRNLVIGVHAREEGADLAAWQPPILSNFDTASFTPMNPDEVLIGKTSEGKTVVSESARKHEPKFPVLSTAEQLTQCLAVQARAFAIVAPKSQLTDFREFINWFTVLSHDMHFTGLFNIYCQIATTYTTLRRSFFLGRDAVSMEPTWMSITELAHIRATIHAMKARFSRAAVKERTDLTTRLTKLELELKQKKSVWNRLDGGAGGGGNANKGNPGAGPNKRKPAGNNEQRNAADHDNDGNERNPNKKKKNKGGGDPPAPGAEDRVSFNKFQRRCREMGEEPFPCYDHHVKPDGCNKTDEAHRAKFSHGGPAGTLPEGF